VLSRRAREGEIERHTGIEREREREREREERGRERGVEEGGGARGKGGEVSGVPE